MSFQVANIEMESRRVQYYCTTYCFLCISISATLLFLQCDARIHVAKSKPKDHKLVRSYIGVEKENHLSNIGQPLELSSPFSLPPFDSLSPQNSPSFCAFPPSTSITNSSPPPTSTPCQAKPEPPPLPPPPTNSPLTPEPTSAPNYRPSPPKHSPSPSLLYPPPPLSPPRGVGGPPPDHKRPGYAVWCVAKPTVPDNIMQVAMDYACGSGADCKSIQPNEPCFQPNTLLAHASYAFNSYFQNRKRAGGTCDFAGTAMLVTDDPSFDGCTFINS